MKSIMKLCGIIFSLVAIFCVVFYVKGFYNPVEEEYPFRGNGTASNPYLIDSHESLLNFRDLVNSGNSFEDVFFLQIEDIDLDNEEWIPIGIYSSGNYFRGVYDGGGHCIENLFISSRYLSTSANVGFFGLLSGTVKNLGIESGSIEGEYVGAIASHGTDNSLILNCYNKAKVSGTGRAGGICDNLNKGNVINCINLGEITAPVTGTVSYTAGYVTAIYPDSLSAYFSGEYYSIKLFGKNEKEILNNGLEQLIDAKIIERKDVTMWQ